MDTTDSELNRVLEAVLFLSLILLGGEPGIGKARCYFNTNYPINFICFWRRKPKTNKNEGRKNHSTSDNCYILTETKTQNIFKQIEAIGPKL
jgi:DNA repair protein RadA/Sms